MIVTAWGTDHGTKPALISASRWPSFLGDDRSRGLVFTAGLFVLFAVLDRWTDALVLIGPDDFGYSTLIGASLSHRWWLHLLTAAAAAGLTAFAGRRLWGAWEDLDHGWALRRLAALPVIVLIWQNALYDTNYLAAQSHRIDRWILLLLGVAVVLRPVALIPFVVQTRVISDQFQVPFGDTILHDGDRALLLILLATAAVHLRYVATGRRDTSDAVLVITAGLVAPFFASGWDKFQIDWLSRNDLGNLPLAAHSAGWFGSNDGWWARGLSVILTRLGWGFMVSALVIELAAPVAAFKPRLARVWLPLAIVFHLAVFAATGIWFLAWLAVEIALLNIVFRASTAAWVAPNDQIGRGVIAVVAATIGAGLIFQPQAMAWYDAPVSYGYRFEVVGVSGERYNLPVTAFAPLDGGIAEGRLQLAGFVPLSGPYGTLDGIEDLDRLAEVNDLETLAALEAANGTPDPDAVARSQRLLEAWLAQVNDGTNDDFPMTAPGDHWTSAPDPVYDLEEPIASLEVYLVTMIHDDGGDPFDGGDHTITRDTLVHTVDGTAFLPEQEQTG